jgi:hypothetical protein
MTALKDSVLRDTGDVREKLLRVWKLVDEKKISIGEARLQVSLARAVLETLKVEIAAAHLAQAQIPTVSLSSPVTLVQRRQ